MQKTQPTIAHSIGTLPFIGQCFQNYGYGTNIFTAGIILSIMVTPIITAIIRDVLAVAPPELEQGALGLGATWWQATRLVLGFSKMGILGAVILGFARAIGETMAVTMVIGNSIDSDNSLFASGQSIASLLAVQFRNADTEGEIQALIYAAFMLLVITTLINGIARVLIVRVAAKGGKR
jgi:phosphate transport system permease protein